MDPLLEMWFDEDAAPRLVETRFRHPLLHDMAHRRLEELTSSCGAFPWSHVPQAMSLFFLKVRLWSLNHWPTEPCRFHDQPEQSLGESIRKLNSPETWKTRIFGHDSSGGPLIYSLLSHGYTSGRHSVELLQNQLPASQIRIHWGVLDISDNPARLRELCHCMLRRYFPLSLRDFLHSLQSFELPEEETRCQISRDEQLTPLIQPDRAATNSPRILLITGGSGFGKSWLARQVASRHRAEGRMVLWVRWDSSYSIRVLMSQIRQEMRTVAWEKDLEAFVKEFPEESDRYMDDARAVGGLFARVPIDLIMDNIDLQNSQSNSLTMFLEGYRQQQTDGTILMTSKRPVASLQHLVHQTIIVPPLTPQQTKDYFSALYPQNAHQLQEGDFQQLHERSRGNFTLIRTLAEKVRVNLSIVPLPHIWDDVPTSGQEVLEQLDASALTLLIQLSAIRSNQIIPFTIIQSLAQEALPHYSNLNSLIAELCMHGLLTTVRNDGNQILGYRISDPVRQMIEDYLQKQKSEKALRKRTHAWLARFYEENGNEPTNLIEAFYHRLMSGEIREGILQVINNEKFLFDLDYTTVLECCLGMVLPRLPRRRKPSRFLGISENLIDGRMAYYHGKYPDALKKYNEAIRLIERGIPQTCASSSSRRSPSREEDDRDVCRRLLLPALEQRGLTHRKLESFEEARADFERCLRLAKDRLVWKAHAEVNLGMIARDLCDIESAMNYIKAGLDSRHLALQTLELNGPLKDAPFWTRELAHIQISDLHVLQAICELDRKNFPAAQEALRVARQHLNLGGIHREDNYYRGRFLGTSAFVHAHNKRWSEAIRIAQEAYDFPRRKCNRAGELAGQHVLGMVHLLRWLDPAERENGQAKDGLPIAERHLLECRDKMQSLQREDAPVLMPLRMARLHLGLQMLYQALNNQGMRNNFDRMARQYAKLKGCDITKINPLTPLM